MSILNEKKILVTHNGSFHADDIFATAVLSILNQGNIKIIRTRDLKIIATGDYVYDVGGENNPIKDLFDHHQKGGGGIRSNEIPYSSFGLIWKKYGEQICGSREVAELIDYKIVQPIDATDNGMDILIPKIKNVFPYSVEAIFLSELPTWKENKNIDNIFEIQVKKATALLKREIEIAKADIEARNIIMDSYNNSVNKRIIMLSNDFPRYLYQKTLASLPEPIYVILPSGHDDMWKVEAVNKSTDTMVSRKPFPIPWRGLSNGDSELKNITEVDNIIFCHQSGFLLAVGSKKNAILLAEKALIA